MRCMPVLNRGPQNLRDTPHRPLLWQDDKKWLPLQSNSPVTLHWTRFIIKLLPSHIVTILIRCKLTPYNEMTPIDPVLQYAPSLLIKPYILLTTGEVCLLLWTQIEIFNKVDKIWHFLPVCYSLQRYFFQNKITIYLADMMWTECVQWWSILTGYRMVSSGDTSRYAFQRYICQNK